MKKRLTLGVIISLTLAGCGKDDGPDDTSVQEIPVPPYTFATGDMEIPPSAVGELSVGIYQFTATNPIADDDPGSPGIALISPTGRLAIVTGSLVDGTRIKTANDSFDSALQLTEGSDSAENVTIKGQPKAGSSVPTIDGTLVDGEDHLTTYEMTYNQQVSKTPIGLAEIAGTYVQSTPDGITKRISVSAEGLLTGSDTTGCYFDGAISTPQPGVNLLEAKYSASNCGASNTQTIEERNGTFFSLGYAAPSEYSIHLFSISESASNRFSGISTFAPVPEKRGFVTDNFAPNDQVVQNLNPGVFAYEEIKPPLTASERADYESQLEDLQTQRSSLQAQRSSLQTQRPNLQGEKVSLESDRASLEGELEDLTSDDVATPEEIEAVEQEIADVNQQIADINQQIAEIDQQINDVDSQLIGVEEDVVALKDLLSSPDTGLAITSPTGRIAFSTDNRTLFAQARLSETLTFTNDAFDFVRDVETTAPMESGEAGSATSIYGNSEDQSGTPGMTGTLLTETGDMDSRYRLTRSASLSDTGATLSATAGTYAMQWGTGITTTLTIDTSGALTGSDNAGCTYNGEVILPDASLNVIEARIEASNCQASDTATGQERNGTYNALGLMSDTTTLRLLMTNKEYSFNYTGTR